MNTTTWLLLGWGFILVSCGANVSLKDRPCPCSSGWTCCESSHVCVAAGTPCEPTSDAGVQSSTGASGAAGAKPNKCHGSGAGKAAFTGSAPDAMAQRISCSSSTPCEAPDVCIMLPGIYTDALGPIGWCGPACESDCDCPAWLTCQGGLCATCSTCPAGQRCSWVAPPVRGDCANGPCGLGAFCVQAGACESINVCVECSGFGCPSCTQNSHCQAGEVCTSQGCQSCTTNSECGPKAQCTETHTGMQCTCAVDSDCAAGESCQGGTCGAALPACGMLGSSGCANGQACIHGACEACSSFEDCNTDPYGFGGTNSLLGLACVNGVCTACTANSQCGGGQACVAGTCGTCSTDAQCGSRGQCTDGYCVCTTDSQCATGQRCGAGVCVET